MEGCIFLVIIIVTSWCIITWYLYFILCLLSATQKKKKIKKNKLLSRLYKKYMVKKIYMLNCYSLVFLSFPFISPPYSLTLSSSYLQRTLTIWDTIVPASLMYILRDSVWEGGYRLKSHTTICLLIIYKNTYKINIVVESN